MLYSFFNAIVLKGNSESVSQSVSSKCSAYSELPFIELELSTASIISINTNSPPTHPRSSRPRSHNDVPPPPYPHNPSYSHDRPNLRRSPNLHNSPLNAPLKPLNPPSDNPRNPLLHQLHPRRPLNPLQRFRLQECRARELPLYGAV